MTRTFFLMFLSAFFVSGCASTNDPNVERGPENTIVYNVPVEANEPGAKIEVNYKVVGTAPLTIKILGDRDGTFHNFGSDEFVVRGYPTRPEEFPQTKIFKTGAFGVKDDMIPKKIVFVFDPAPGTSK